MDIPRQLTIPPMPNKGVQTANTIRCFTILVDKNDAYIDALSCLMDGGFLVTEITNVTDPYRTILVSKHKNN